MSEVGKVSYSVASQSSENNETENMNFQGRNNINVTFYEWKYSKNRHNTNHTLQYRL